MLRRGIIPMSLVLVFASGLLALLSCEGNAKQEKEASSKQVAKQSRPKKCCLAGFQGCPTGGDDGCDCCGASVTATLEEYDQQKKEGKLKIQGLDNESVPFTVVDPGVAKQLPKKGDSGKFILKLNEYPYDREDPRTKKTKRWYGKRFECEGIGDNNGQMKDKTQDFVAGWKLTDTIYKVQVIVEDAVPKYDPERDEDRR